MNIQEKRKRLGRRSRRVRLRIVGLSSRPRLSVFRSNAHIYAQIIDDVAGRTLVS
ncbi:MAG: 50S ribosomal protein L18, partial [Nitrospirota bacterium]|nr:50S ribosomal protein L18 [Nitrospirota bacterium]